MNKNKLGKAKNSVNELDANKSNSGVLDTEMAIMYNISNRISDINDVDLEEKGKLENETWRETLSDVTKESCNELEKYQE